MYISQPTGNIKYAYHKCDEGNLDVWLDDGTPVVCTSSAGVFYVMGGSMGGTVLAGNINKLARNGTQFHHGLRRAALDDDDRDDRQHLSVPFLGHDDREPGQRYRRGGRAGDGTAREGGARAAVSELRQTRSGSN